MEKEIHFILNEQSPTKWEVKRVKVVRADGAPELPVEIQENTKIVEFCCMIALLKMRYELGLEPASSAKEGEEEKKLHGTFRAQYYAANDLHYMRDIFSNFDGVRNVVVQQGQKNNSRVRFANNFSPDAIKFLNTDGSRADLSRFLHDSCGIQVTTATKERPTARDGATLVEHQRMDVENWIYPVAKTQKEIAEALVRDFRSLSIDDQYQSNLESLQILESLGLIRKAISPGSYVEQIHDFAAKGLICADNRFTLDRFPEVTVQCLTNAPSCVASFKEMQTGDLKLRINLLYYQPHGYDLAMALGARDFQYDFLCSAQQGLHYYGKEEVSKYHHVLSLQTMKQYLYVNSENKDFPKKIYYPSGTSGEEAAKLLKPQLKGTVDIEIKPKDLALIIKSGLNSGEGAILWKAKAAPKNWTVFPGIELTDVRFCLYAHESWMTQDKRSDLRAFRNAFVATWKRLQNKTKEAWKLLQLDSVYQKYYDINCGMISEEKL